MDYSLLLGISTLDPAAEDTLRTQAAKEAAAEAAAAGGGESKGVVDREFRSVFQADGGGLRGWNADGSARNEMYVEKLIYLYGFKIGVLGFGVICPDIRISLLLLSCFSSCLFLVLPCFPFPPV